MAALSWFLHATVLTSAFRRSFSEPERNGPNRSEPVRTSRRVPHAPYVSGGIRNRYHAETRSLTLVLMPSHHLPSMGTHRTAPHNHTPSACSFYVHSDPFNGFPAKISSGCGRCLSCLCALGPGLCLFWYQFGCSFRGSPCVRPLARFLSLAVSYIASKRHHGT